ncbi:hypothetical protein FQR65_LT08489 [Abscondita terminalis]|nr:hypothetical protein FQR65_LT08489 [Abscondita terminalis]
MGKNKAIMNPVQPSPWTSSAPLGCSSGYQRRHQHQTNSQTVKSYKILVPTETEKLRTDRQHLHSDSLFRHLNRNTLILIFPNVSIRQIDAVLVLCNNSLSEAINILKKSSLIDRQRNNTRYILPRLPQTPTNHTVQSILGTSNEVKYIPTKYKDVQIVEINNSARPNNTMVSTVPDSTQNGPFKNYNKYVVPPPILPKDNLTPPSTSPSLTSPQQLDEHTVEINTDKPEQKSMSPNQILERALTFYSPYPQDN